MSRRDSAPSDDRSESPYANLDDDERAEAMAHESGVRGTPQGGRWLSGEVPRQPGVVLTCRSIWVGAAVAVLAFSVFGAIVQGMASIAVAGVVLAMVMVVRGRGPARKVEVLDTGDLVIQGGFWGRTARLSVFDWAAVYESTNGPIRIGRASTAVLHREDGRHVFARVIAVCFPTVSHRRAAVVLSSMWRFSGGGQRVPDNAMADFFRAACRDSGMRVSRGRGGRIWTASRSPRPS